MRHSIRRPIQVWLVGTIVIAVVVTGFLVVPPTPTGLTAAPLSRMLH